MTILNDRQRMCLSLIMKSYQKRGKAPTIRELVARIGSSTMTICRAINELEDMGYIARQKQKTAGIKVLKDLDGDPVKMTTVFTKVKA